MSSLFSLAFSLSIAVGWEIYEFSMDQIYGMTLQRGNTDTMVDFICCATGSVLAMLLVAFLRNGIMGKNKAEVKAQRQKEKEERLLKEKLYKEYIKAQGEEK